MPCFFPKQVPFKFREDGKKELKFGVDVYAKMFRQGLSLPDNVMNLACGSCKGCRADRTRDWAIRMHHESKMHDKNCFVTFTFNDESLLKMCPDGSIVLEHMQDFNKRLRKRYSDERISVFYCGEYGDQLGRPHYHSIIFNHDFEDKKFWKYERGKPYFTSVSLSELWSYGFTTLSDVTFESAAYVARYCFKKINGDKADEHYGGKTPEFARQSNRPAIGLRWLEKFGYSDVFMRDEVVVKGYPCRPPRFYDKKLEEWDPLLYDFNKLQRVDNAKAAEFENSYRRLEDRFKCFQARMGRLIRGLEVK